MGTKMRHDLHSGRDLVRSKGYEHYGDEFLRGDPVFTPGPDTHMEEVLQFLRTYKGDDPFLRRMERSRRSARRLGKQWLPTGAEYFKIRRHMR